MEKVNVLYCFDSKFWRMASVSIESMLSNAKDTTQIIVHCIVAPKTKGYRKIKKIIKSHKSGAGLVWRVIKPKDNPYQNYNHIGWSPATYYRLLAYRLFKDLDKILYLDSDTMVCGDIAELYKTDISDYVFGAVRDMANINDEKNALGAVIRDFSEKYLNNGPYYNTGVLLLNLKKMAENEHLLFETKVPLRFVDQDLLNAAFVGKIKTLPLKYNLAPCAGIPSHFTKEEADEVSAGGHVILHCYWGKFWDKAHCNKFVYDLYAKYCNNVGITPDFFVKARQAKERNKKIFAPFVNLYEKAIAFLGIK